MWKTVTYGKLEREFIQLNQHMRTQLKSYHIKRSSSKVSKMKCLLLILIAYSISAQPTREEYTVTNKAIEIHLNQSGINCFIAFHFKNQIGGLIEFDFCGGALLTDKIVISVQRCINRIMKCGLQNTYTVLGAAHTPWLDEQIIKDNIETIHEASAFHHETYLKLVILKQRVPLGEYISLAPMTKNAYDFTQTSVAAGLMTVMGGFTMTAKFHYECLSGGSYFRSTNEIRMEVPDERRFFMLDDSATGHLLFQNGWLHGIALHRKVRKKFMMYDNIFYLAEPIREALENLDDGSHCSTNHARDSPENVQAIQEV